MPCTRSARKILTISAGKHTVQLLTVFYKKAHTGKTLLTFFYTHYYCRNDLKMEQ